ncbi:MAG: glycosyl hydrolase [Eubacterium sp.]
MLGYKYILAYNEPDREDQANMSVDTAIEGMKSLVGKGLKVGSPAAAIWPSISTDWFQPFMKKMKEEKMDVDFIALHHYWNWYTEDGAKAFLDIVDETWKMYHKPIWITEFALSGVPNRTKQTRQSAINYMKYVLPELDKREYVERYAWFSFQPSDYRNGGSAMLNTYTGEITGLGMNIRN